MKPYHQIPCLLMLWCLLIAPAVAFQWKDLWETKDHQAQTMMKNGQYEDAEKTFINNEWRATAAFRAKNYQQAASLYAQSSNADGYYNAANALAHLGQYHEALQAYDKALSLNPQHADARHNRDIVKQLLKKQSEKNTQNAQHKSQTSPDDQTNQSQDQQKQSKQDTDKPKDNQSKHQSQGKDQDAQKEPDQDKSDKPSSNRSEPTQSEPQEKPDESAQNPLQPEADKEQQQTKDQWLRLIPDDPSGLLREKFLRDHLRRTETQP